MKIYLNGQLVDEKDAKISVLDHGLLYGDGVFEGIRVYNGNIFKLDAHLDRLYASAEAIHLTIPLEKADLAKATRTTVGTNDVRNGYIRVVCTRGVGTLGLNPRLCAHPSVFIIADSITLYPEEAYTQGLAVCIASTIRNHPAALPPQVKSLNYLNNILAKIEGLQCNVPEAIMKNHEGNIAECTGDNIFAVKDGKLYTPPVDAGILEGITRATAIDLAKEADMDVVERNFDEAFLLDADECFLTGTAAEIVPVVRIGDTTIGDGKPGPVTRDLLARFQAITKEG